MDDCIRIIVQTVSGVVKKEHCVLFKRLVELIPSVKCQSINEDLIHILIVIYTLSGTLSRMDLIIQNVFVNHLRLQGERKIKSEVFVVYIKGVNNQMSAFQVSYQSKFYGIYTGVFIRK